MERSWKVMEFEICIPGLEVMEFRKICFGHGISDFSPNCFQLMVKKLFKFRKHVKHQNVYPMGHFTHCFYQCSCNVEIIELHQKSWEKSWKSHGIFFLSFCVNPVFSFHHGLLTSVETNRVYYSEVVELSF